MLSFSVFIAEGFPFAHSAPSAPACRTRVHTEGGGGGGSGALDAETGVTGRTLQLFLARAASRGPALICLD